MKKIIFSRPDGGISVVTPAINTYPVREEITEEQALQRAWDRLPKDAINPQIVEPSAIPSDRTFRNAWQAGAGTVEYDMEKCRDIHKNLLRELRAPLFTCLDVAFMKALELGDTKTITEIAAKKQALRDVTADPAIARAVTPEELKVVVPRVLLPAAQV